MSPPPRRRRGRRLQFWLQLIIGIIGGRPLAE